MRLIDADALKERIFTTTFTESNMWALNLSMGMIDEAPTIGGWISVKDRLPKSVANKVLVWIEHDDLVGYIGYGHYEKYNGVEMWYDLEHGEQFSKRGYTVTHWMPLPEPPKEEG